MGVSHITYYLSWKISKTSHIIFSIWLKRWILLFIFKFFWCLGNFLEISILTRYLILLRENFLCCYIRPKRIIHSCGDDQKQTGWLKYHLKITMVPHLKQSWSTGPHFYINLCYIATKASIFTGKIFIHVTYIIIDLIDGIKDYMRVCIYYCQNQKRLASVFHVWF